MKTFSIKIGKGRNPMMLDAETLIGTRALVQGKSGSGKSHLVRVILEQAIAKGVQVIVFDPSGEFKTLREKCDLLIAGHLDDGADVPLEIRSAKQLLRRVAETGISCVLDMSELGTKTHQREFVRIGLETLHGLPRKHWGARIIVIDECQDYAPESGKGKAQSLEAVVTTASQGRKRGHCLIAVTQRLSRLSKDVSAECQNKFIANTDHIDLKRAQDVLGCTAEDREKLRKFKPGEFYAVGPALNSQDTERFVGRPSTTTHPKPGARHKLKAPPPSNAVKKRVLKDFEALPPSKDAEDAQTLADAKKKIRELERQLKKAEQAPKGSPKIAAAVTSEVRKLKEKISEMGRASMEAYDEGEAAGDAKAKKEIEHQLKPITKKLRTLDTALNNLMARALGIRDELNAQVADIEQLTYVSTKPKRKKSVTEVRRPEVEEAVKQATKRVIKKAQAVGGGTEKPEFSWKSVPGRFLSVLIQYHGTDLTPRRVAALAGIPFKKSTTRGAIAKLLQRGYVERLDSLLMATEEAVERFGGSVESLPSGEDIVEQWKQKLGNGVPYRMFEAALEIGGDGNPIDPDALADLAEVDRGSSTFRGGISTLKKKGLFEDQRNAIVLAEHVRI